MIFKVRELNLDDIQSKLIENIKYEFINEYLDMEFNLHFIEENILKDFNDRNINPENINEILSLCDFILLKDTLNFIIKNSKPTNKIYYLNEYHKEHYKLPKFMIGDITCIEAKRLKCDKWLNYSHNNGCNNYYDDIKKCFWNVY
jgi:hypothetical protein